MKKKRLKIYTDVSMAEDADWVPFYLHARSKELGIYDQLSEQHRREADKLQEHDIPYELTSLDDCDVLGSPGYWFDYGEERKWNWMVEKFDKLSKEVGKPVIVMFGGDSEGPLHFGDNVILLRCSVRKSEMRKNEFPYSKSTNADELTAELFYHKHKPKTPKVGFCGCLGFDFKAPNNKVDAWFKEIRERYFIGNIGLHQFFEKCGIQVTRNEGYVVRVQATQHLRNSKLIDSNFIIRNRFYGGSRKEFVKNLQESHYGLCMRGKGNFSFRFYECLSLGRIPVFINTDCALPYEELIPWKETVLWVEQKDIGRLDEIILEDWNQMSDDDFYKRQQRCREIWLEYLTTSGYTKHLGTYFDSLPRRST